ncbi:hypothetical protein PSTT_14333, partial [Puccinia striiformis]
MMIDDPFNPDLPCHTKADFITFLHRHDKTIILPTKLNIDDLRKLACARARELACARARLQQLDKSPSAPFDSFIRRPRRQCTLNPQPGTPPSTGKGTRISPKRAVSTPLPKGSSPGNSGGLPDSKHNSRADLHFFSATSKPPARQSPAVPSLDSRTISTPPRNKTRVKDGGQSALKQPSDRGKARVLPKTADSDCSLGTLHALVTSDHWYSWPEPPAHRFTTVCNIDFNLSKAPPKDSSPDEIWVPDPSFIRKAPRQRDILEAAAKLDALEKARWARAVTPPCPAAEDVVQTPVDLIELAQSDVPLSISLGSGHQNRNDLDLLKMSPDIGPLPEPISHDVPPMITLALPEPLVSDANSTDPGEFSNEFYAMFDPCSALNPDSSLNLETLEWPTPIDRTVATTFLEMKIGTSKFLRRREAASQEEVDGLTGALAKAIPKPFDNPNDLDRRFSIAAGSEIPTSANNPFTKLLGCDSIFSSPIELAKNHTKTSSISTTHTRPNRNDQLALHCLEGMCSPQDITVASARSIPKILHSPTDPVGHCLISITASSDFATFVSSLVRIVDRNSHAIGRINMLSNKNAHNQLVRYSSKGMCPPRVLDAGIARQSYSSSLANNNVYMSLPGCSTTITEPGDSVQIKPSYVRMSRAENVYAISTVEPPDARELRFHPSEEIYPQKSENVAFEKPEERVSTIIKSPASPSIKPRRILDLVPTNEPLIIFNAALANSDLVENALHEAISAEFN